MTPSRVHLLTGVLSGFVVGLIISALLLAWPIRALAFAGVAGAACVVVLWRGGPLRRWQLLAGGFVMGYALAVVALAGLDLVFPPIP